LARSAGPAGPTSGGEQSLAVGLGDELALAVVRLGQEEVWMHQHGSVSLSAFPVTADASIFGR
jgi:hypothetical protein